MDSYAVALLRFIEQQYQQAQYYSRRFIADHHEGWIGDVAAHLWAAQRPHIMRDLRYYAAGDSALLARAQDTISAMEQLLHELIAISANPDSYFI